MESSEDKHWATKYLLDPLNAPEPSAETGPGTTHSAQASSTSRAKPTSAQAGDKSAPSVTVRSAAASEHKPTPASSVRSTANNPYRSSKQQKSTAYPSPPSSASPNTAKFPDIDGGQGTSSNRFSQASTQIPTSTGGQRSSTHEGSVTTNPDDHGRPRRRTSSLQKRHPGDLSHRPLDMIRKDVKAADRAPHLKKKHLPGADSIDQLDLVGANGFAYHHEGPYDATLLARNTSYITSPVEAVRGSNNEALRATPREMIKDSVTRHRPLDGTAMYPPGMADPYGRVLNYHEGPNMMIDGQPGGGAYRRWPGVNYLPDDIKGKGEPSYSLEKALKAHSLSHRRVVSESHKDLGLPPSSSRSSRYAGGAETSGIELMDTPSMSASTAGAGAGAGARRRRPRSVEGRRPPPQPQPQQPLSPVSPGGGQQSYADWERGSGSGLGRSDSLGGKLKKKVGSLSRRKPVDGKATSVVAE